MAEIGLFEAMYSARALRRFKPDPVPNEVLSKVLDAAIRAPSGSNAQSWVFIVIKDAGQRERIAAIYRKAGRLMMPAIAARESPHMPPKQRELMIKSAGHLFEHMDEAPVLLLACLKATLWTDPSQMPPEARAAAERGQRIAGSSIYPAVQNIILACRGLGLGTVLTTLHTLHEDEVKQVLDLPADLQTYALLPIGYPIGKFGPVKRRPISEVARLDRFGTAWPG